LHAISNASYYLEKEQLFTSLASSGSRCYSIKMAVDRRNM